MGHYDRSEADDLRYADISGIDLFGADMHEANLREANLAGADLRWANLTGADLSWANLTGADFDVESLPAFEELRNKLSDAEDEQDLLEEQLAKAQEDLAETIAERDHARESVRTLEAALARAARKLAKVSL